MGYKFVLNYFVMFVFPQSMASSPLDPRGVGAVDVGHDVIIGVVHSSIAQGLQEYDLVMVMFLLLQRLHYFSPLPV